LISQIFCAERLYPQKFLHWLRSSHLPGIEFVDKQKADCSISIDSSVISGQFSDDSNQRDLVETRPFLLVADT